MRKLIPVVFVVLGLLVGGGAGWFLRPIPDPKDQCQDCDASISDNNTESEAPVSPGASDTAHGAEAAVNDNEFVKLNNQFIVPDIQNGAVVSLVVMSLSVEVAAGKTERVYAVEPRLRDILLQVLFDHANAGGFQGDFTSASRMAILRRALFEAVQEVLDKDVKSILISDIIRQDMV